MHRANVKTKKIIMSYQEKISQLALDIKTVLKPHQLYTLENYVACLIPPKQGAAGQADNPEAGLKQLTALRVLPDPTFKKRKEEIAQRILEQMKEHLPKGYVIDVEEEKRWILSLLEVVRSLSDRDFALYKIQLARELRYRHALPKLPIDVSVKIERYLLNSAIIPLLSQKLKS